MSELLLLILGLIGMFVVVGGVAYLLQRNVQKNGNLFTRPPSFGIKVIAFLLGLLFLGFFAMEFVYGTKIHVISPILAIVLFAYAFGAEKLIQTFQNSDKK
jgi:hypothetical protein